MKGREIRLVTQRAPCAEFTYDIPSRKLWPKRFKPDCKLKDQTFKLQEGQGGDHHLLYYKEKIVIRLWQNTFIYLVIKWLFGYR